MESIFKVGIIGCGGIANNKHMPALKRLGEVEMVAFCDIVEERAQKAKEQFGTPDARVYTDYKELLLDDSIHAVHVLTPNRSHAFITVDSLRAGRHVMCEKPMAKTSADAMLMLDAAKETGKILTIGYQNRCRPDSIYLKKACENGELGEIYYAKAHAIRRRAVPTWGVFLNEYEQGGGPLIDIGTHALDLTMWMMDNYEPRMVMGSVYKKLGDQTETGNAWGDWNPDEYTVEDSAFGFITMKNGATIVLESSWALNSLDVGEAKTTLCGTRAGADMREGLRINYVKHNTQVQEIPALDAGKVDFFEGLSNLPQDVEARAFYNAIKTGEPPMVSPAQAYVVTQILEAIYESAKTGCPVMFD
ncbi:MAG: Gfo/Idh/MocA family protein [Acetanaerobacterium sp.]